MENLSDYAHKIYERPSLILIALDDAWIKII